MLADLRDAGWQVSKKTVEASMQRQRAGGAAREAPSEPDRGRYHGAAGAGSGGPDLSAEGPNIRWCGDLKQIDTDEGPCYH